MSNNNMNENMNEPDRKNVEPAHRSTALDRLPPHSTEAEQGVIGCCLTTPKGSVSEACEVILSTEFFYEVRHQIIWDAIVGMEVEKVDSISVLQKLKDAGTLESIGGAAYLSECQDAAIGASFLSNWLDIVKSKHVLRMVISTCTRAIQSAYGGGTPCFELIAGLERDVLAINPTKTNAYGMRELVYQAVEKIEHRVTHPNELSGLSTGLRDLDRLTDGLHKGELVVIAGFPSTGKTALAVNICVTNALNKTPGAVFSAEMRPVQIVVRSICSESRVNFYKVTEYDCDRMKNSITALAHAPLYIEQANHLSIGQVCAMARRLKQKHDIQLAVVDYIQLLTGSGDNREQEISSISKGVKAMALELDIPVLALSQLTDDGKLRESRSIGQDADSVWKLAMDGEWQPAIQPIKLKVEKCRDGATGVVDLTFLKEYTRFSNAAIGEETTT